MTWIPKRSISECDALMTAPGELHEIRQKMIDGRILKVYKNLWPTLRDFFLMTVQLHSNKEFVIFENDRMTFQQTLDQAVQFAGMLRDVYGVKKGDHIGIVSRNYPEYYVAFWGIQLLGGVCVLVNAWLPHKPLHHCIIHTHCKLVIVDPERAVKLDVPTIKREAKTLEIIVMRPHEARNQKFEGMITWDKALNGYRGNAATVLLPHDQLPDDSCAIFFTSGTTGLPKGVLVAHRGFLTNTFNIMAMRLRVVLRNGELSPSPNSILASRLGMELKDGVAKPIPDPNAKQKGVLMSIPLFHATGFIGLSILPPLMGMKVVLMRKWDKDQAAHIINTENISVAGGVPSIISDLIESPAAGSTTMESFLFGGAPPPAGLAELTVKTFPNAMISQAYGLTETNAAVVNTAGEDYIYRNLSCGVACPVNELAIVTDGKALDVGELGEIWIKGVSNMREYYNDPKATEEALTPDGWFKSGDLGYLDDEGFLYIKDRAKDIIIRGGENVASITVENALYADPRVMEAAAVGIPDERLGELVAAVVTLKDGHSQDVTEQGLIQLASQSLPRFAIPVMVMIEGKPLERNPAFKVIKTILRKRATEEWTRRNNKVRARL